MKALIKVGYGCNEHCTFCHTIEYRHLEGEASEVYAKIDRAHALGHTMVVLSGGEPTLRPELFAWAERIAALGMDFGLVTNGLLLAYPEAVERLLRHRLKYVYMSKHGGSKAVHNRLVRADTFDAATQAVANLSGKGLDFTVNCVVTRGNVKALREMVDSIVAYPDVRLKFSMVAPKGGGDRHFDAVTPTVTLVAERVHDALTYALERARVLWPSALGAWGASRHRFGHDGLPLCLMPGFEDLFDDLKTHRFATMVEIGEPDFFPVDEVIKTHPPPCDGCVLRGPCPGLYSGYVEGFGHSEVRAVTGGARSNSFNYVFEALTTTTYQDGAPCPLLLDGVNPWDRGRTLFVRNGARFARFRTQTRDFGDDELLTLKHGLGQVYLDVSRKAAPDDFGKDLLKLERSALCTACPERERCTGLFEPAEENVFARDDGRLRALLATLRGDVVDLGCGEGPYAEALAPSVLAGRVRYLGLDPDAARLEVLRRARPWATLRTGVGEELASDTAAFPAASFDAVLILRSWNHLREPAAALQGALRVLRPGGQLIVVDNVAFGLARTPAQTARGESGPAGFEHYRNDDAAAAHACIAPFGFRLAERWDVAPATSNQWLLRYHSGSGEALAVSGGRPPCP